MGKLSHIDDNNRPTMVDVGDKAATDRTAHARTIIELPDVVVAELDLAPLIAPLPDWQLARVSVYPPHVFDLAFVLADSVTVARFLDVVRRAADPHLEHLELFDEYRGVGVADGHRSLAVRLTLRAMDHTLSDEEVAPIRTSIIDAVAAQLEGSLRGSV